jgi:hypothetical protein
MAQHDTLGLGGGAAGEENCREVVGIARTTH